MRITIEGPQGCGKTKIARALMEFLSLDGKSVAILEEGDQLFGKTPDVVIEVKNT